MSHGTVILMQTFLGFSATTWTGIYTLLTAGLLLVAVVAALYAHFQWRSARQQVEEQRRAQVEAMRPFVIVSVEPSRASMQLFDLIVRNVGQRPAQGVRIIVDPEPVRAREMDDSNLHMRAMKILNEPMALLAPGQEIRAFYDNHLERKQRDDLPTEHQVSVSYSDTSGQAYRGAFTLDLMALEGMSWTNVGTIHTISDSLKRIEGTLRASSTLERNARIEVHAVTEPRREHVMREEIEEHENLKGHTDLLRQVTPGDASIARYEKRLRSEQEAFQRRLEDEAVEPVRRRLRQTKLALDWARRRLRKTDP